MAYTLRASMVPSRRDIFIALAVILLIGFFVYAPPTNIVRLDSALSDQVARPFSNESI
jgi:hypothetical protein